jgi:hypothetical protein
MFAASSAASLTSSQRDMDILAFSSFSAWDLMAARTMDKIGPSFYEVTSTAQPAPMEFSPINQRLCRNADGMIG